MDQTGNVKKIPFILITGFLGSGKTTFLNELIAKFSGTYRLGIIQNEFAKGNVDGQQLKRSTKTFDLLEINNGSVFCVCLLSSFTQSLNDFIEEYNPDMIFLEASGLSDPISIAELLQTGELKEKLYLSYIWTLIDAGNFLKIGKTLPRIQHQVRIADEVLINKADLGSENLSEIKNWIKKHNPYCSIQETNYCRRELDIDIFPNSKDPVALKRSVEHSFIDRGDSPDTSSYVIKTTRKISSHSLKQFLEEVAPKAYRIKGFVRLDSGETMAIQSVFGKLNMEIVKDYLGPTELIGIGPSIDSLSFGKRFREYQKIKT